MANSTLEPEFDLKKRLVGAFALIAFAVVVLPAVLGGKGHQNEGDDRHAGPSLESKVFVSKITPIGGATPELQTGSADPDQPPAGEAPQLEPVVPAKPKPSTGDSTSSQQSQSQAASRPVASDEPGWVVRVGTFAQQANVDRVVERLRKAGFDPSTTKLANATRVWLGPFSQRVEAARMRTRVRQIIGGEAYIAAYP